MMENRGSNMHDATDDDQFYWNSETESCTCQGIPKEKPDGENRLARANELNSNGCEEQSM